MLGEYYCYSNVLLGDSEVEEYTKRKKPKRQSDKDAISLNRK